MCANGVERKEKENLPEIKKKKTTTYPKWEKEGNSRIHHSNIANPKD